MSNTFSAFTEAMARQSSPSPASDHAAAIERVAILGGGVDARLLAALCIGRSMSVRLFSAYGQELELLRQGSGITLRGAGPIGTIAVDREDGPAVQTTGELDVAVADADLIVLTGPIHKQRTYAMVLADHLRDGQILLVPQARTFGALETAWYLRIGGCEADISIAEMCGMPHWVEAAGSVLTLGAEQACPVAVMPSVNRAVIGALQQIWPHAVPVPHVLRSALSDGSALVEVPSLLMGGPAIGDAAPDIPMGGQPLPENVTFRALIGDEHHAVIEQLAGERRAVAACFGERDLPTTETWLDQHAGALRGADARPVPDAAVARALIRDGVLGSLLPLLSAADIVGVEAPVTRSMVTLFGAMAGSDPEGAGRCLARMGLASGALDATRRKLDRMVKGDR